MISEDCTRNMKEDCDCNEIEIMPMDRKSRDLQENIFGRYFISSNIVSHRETYLSEKGVFTIWYDEKIGNWNVGFRKDLGSEKSVISLNLKKTSNFDSTKTFAWNANGINFWGTKSDKIQVKVICSSKIGKMFSIFRICTYFIPC